MLKPGKGERGRENICVAYIFLIKSERGLSSGKEEENLK